MKYHFEPIGTVRSCFTEKFGVPRQPGLVPEARAVLELLPAYSGREILRELEGFSHLWVVFVFHGTAGKGWAPTVRPPRLGGNRRVGVFASRSPFRPNPIGMSVVRLEAIRHAGGGSTLELGGVDLLDGTPVLDIKPYLSWADAVDGAEGGFAGQRPGRRLAVTFLPGAEAAIEAWERSGPRPGLKRLVRALVEMDPRPSYRRTESGVRGFAMKIYDIDVRWEVRESEVAVVTAAVRTAP